MANDIIGIVVTDNSDNVQLNVTPNLVSINVSQTSGNIIGSNYFLANNYAALPVSGESTTLYITNDTSLMYRWSANAYVQVNSVTSWGTIAGTLSSQTDLQNALNLKAPLASPAFTGTVTGVTKTMVGLSNVDNTSDVNKPVSTATQTAIDLKSNINNPTFTGTVGGVTKAMVGLGNVDNTTDLNKPISTATQSSLDTKAPLASPTFTGTVILPSGTVASADLNWTYYADVASLPSATTKHGMFAHVHSTGAGYMAHAGVWIKLANQTDLDLKAPLASPTFTGTVGGVTKAMVGLGSVDNTTDLLKPISTATQTALDGKEPTLIVGTSNQYYRGDKTFQSLVTTAITEGTNLYFTNARSRNAISLTTTGTSGSATYDNTTGILNIPAYQGGVTSFNTRTGAITLNSSDVTTSLGFTPYNATNPNGYTTNVGTVTSVGGTGTVSGLSLSGSITTSGNLNLGGTLSLTSGNVTGALGFTPENSAIKGIANGYASLDGGGLVPSTQLPSYVDDVLEFANLAALPATGETGKIYVTLDTNKIYRWSGATYIEVSPTVGTIWGGITGTLANQTDLQNALNAKQANISLTVTGDSGVSTFASNVLNVPNYTLSGLGGQIALSGTGFVKISGTTISYDNSTYYLASNPSGYTTNVGTVTSVALSVPTGLSITGSPITTSGTLALTYAAGYSIPTAAIQTDWTTAFTNRITSLTTTGSSGASTLVSNVLNIPNYTLAGLGGVPTSRSLTINGTAYDLSADRSWTLTADPNSRNLQDFTATAGQTTFTVTGGYVVGLLDVFVNGSKLTSSEFTATNGTTFVLTVASTVGDQVQSINYTASVNGISGAGTANYVPKFTASGTIGNSLIFDNGTNVGIGTTSGGLNLSVQGLYGLPTTSGTQTVGIFRVQDSASNISLDMGVIQNVGTWIQSGNKANSSILPLSLNPNGGNVGIGTTSPNTLLTVAGANQATGAAFNTYGNVLIYSTDSFAINKGGALSLGGKYNSAGTPIATFARIHGKKESASDGATSGYLSFETTNDANALLTERMRITSAGNVGIGTTTPDVTGFGWTTLTIKGGTTSGSAGVLELQSPTTTGAGNLGVIAFLDGSNRNAQISVQRDTSTSTGNMLFYTNAGAGIAERMRITSGGLFKFQNSGSSYESSTAGVNEFNTNANDTNVVFRNTATSLTAARAGADVFFANAAPNNTGSSFYSAADNAGTRTLRFEVRSNGGIANYSANNVSLSDERTKKDIVPLESYWDKFKSIEMVKFKYKDQTHDDYYIGVIAQQVESVAPEFVDAEGFGITPEDGIPLKSIYTADLYHATIKVLQEAMMKIENQQSQIEELKTLLKA